jgi:hypothetical protein
VFLGVGLLEHHPIVQDAAIFLSCGAALFSITASAVTIYKHLKK